MDSISECPTTSSINNTKFRKLVSVGLIERDLFGLRDLGLKAKTTTTTSETSFGRTRDTYRYRNLHGHMATYVAVPGSLGVPFCGA